MKMDEQMGLDGAPAPVRQIRRATEALGYDRVVGATHDREPKLWGANPDQDPLHDPFFRTTRMSE